MNGCCIYHLKVDKEKSNFNTIYLDCKCCRQEYKIDKLDWESFLCDLEKIEEEE